MTGDIQLLASGTNDSIDCAIVGDDVSAEEGLHTAALLSLLTDRRANDDDEIPSGDGDKRGWWADQFADVDNDLVGSRLWLLDRSKMQGDLALQVEEFVREALAWMLADHVAKSIDVSVETMRDQLQYTVTIHRPTGDPVAFCFFHAWNSEMEMP